MATVAFHTLGCKVNHYESEAMMDLFKEAGYEIVDFDEKADIYIINSCTVTNNAARKSRQFARRAKRKNSTSIVALVGCYAQVSPEEVAEIEEIDYILGTEGKKQIVELVKEASQEDKYLKQVSDFNEIIDYEDLNVVEVRETTRAYVKIEEGCNQFCSYCIIPYARGRVRSREIEAVVDEVKNHLNSGVKEIILTGIHLGAYGLDWEDELALVKLLEKLLKLDGQFRIRLSSIEVTEISDRLLELMATEARLCPHLHLPLQSGSDNILEAMNRPYTLTEFRKTVNKVRGEISDIAITTDIIVGFPGETEEDFNNNYCFIKEMNFSRLHVFPFSPREGTPAAKMENQIHGNIKKKRSKKLRDLNKELMLDYQQQFIGQKRQVLVEAKMDNETDLLEGFTDNYIRVLVPDDEKYRNELLDFKLIKSYNYENAIGKIGKKKEF